MTRDEQAEQVARLFEACVDAAGPAERESLLQVAGAGNRRLRDEVERLWQAYERSGQFLKGGAAPAAEGPDASTPDDLKPGDRVGPYRVIGQIGEGGSSTVFAAEQEEPVRRWVALKIIKPGMDTRAVLVRFGLERQALALMDHPGIAKLLDAGATAGGRPFFVMELVSGTGITRYCDEHRLTIAQRLELFTQVCDAVLHAHQRGIIHRDLKPDNILVAESEGRPALKIIDFGIARVLGGVGADAATRTGATPFLGTPAYMSPEQVRLTSSDIDTRTDIYSLGAVLYELLTGHPPFDQDTLLAAGLDGMFHLIRTVEPVAPSARYGALPAEEQLAAAEVRGTVAADLRRQLAGDLDWITLKALEKDRERRYATAAGLTEDVKRHQEHLPVLAATANRRYRLAKLLRRHRRLVLTVASFAILLLGSALVSIGLGLEARISANRAQRFEQAATAAQRQSHRALVAMHVSSGVSAAERRAFDRAVLWFAEAAEIAGADESEAKLNARRALCWMSRASLPLGGFLLSPGVQQLEFSPDSRYLLVRASGDDWRLWGADRQELVPWSRSVPTVRAAAWSPEGERIVLVSPEGHVRVHAVADGTILSARVVTPVPSAVGFTADGRQLVVGNDRLFVHKLDGAKSSEELPAGSGSVVGLAFAGPGGPLAAVGSDGTIRVMAGDGGATPSFEAPHRYLIRVDACANKTTYREGFLESARLALPALGADGVRLVTRSGTYSIALWDLPTGKVVQRIDDVCCSCRFVTSSQSGLLACGLQGGRVGFWDLASAQPRQVLPSDGTCVLDIAFGYGGERLITAGADGLARIWSVEEGVEVQAPLHHATDVDRVALADNGRLIATVQSDGLVRIWDVVETEREEHDRPRVEYPTVVRLDSGGHKFVLTREPGWESRSDELTLFSTRPGAPAGPRFRFEGGVDAAAFSPDNRQLAVGVDQAVSGTGGRLELRDLERPGSRAMALPSPPVSFAWEPETGALAVLGRDGGLWMIETRPRLAIRWSIPPPQGVARRLNPRLKFSGDGASLVVLRPDGCIEVRSPGEGALRFPPLAAGAEGFWSFALCPDSRHFATSTSSGDVGIWNLADGYAAAPSLKHSSWVYRCRFSPDGKLLATAGHDGRLRVWDWRAGTLRTGPTLHPAEVYDANFTPDGRWILTACRDGQVRIWETATGTLVAPPEKVGHQAFNVEVSPDGEYAVAGSLGPEVAVLSLAMLKRELPYEIAEIGRVAEVVSGCTVQDGAIRDLSTEEWLDRFQGLRQRDADIFRRIRMQRIGRWVQPKVPRETDLVAAGAAPISLPSMTTGVPLPDVCVGCESAAACGAGEPVR